MLPEPFRDHEPPCKLMVNGIPVQSYFYETKPTSLLLSTDRSPAEDL